MNIRLTRRSVLSLLTGLVLGITGSLWLASSAQAASNDGITDQATCDSGTVTYTWSGMGITRPTISALTIDGETIADPVNPTTAGSIGARICATHPNARGMGLAIYRHDADGSNHQDLSTALTPSGQPITANSKITITISNMGQLAKYYTFSLVHGVVSTWTTTGLGSDAATLTVTLSPARLPLAGGGSDWGFCTATPPDCHAAKSDGDVLGVNLAMSFDQSGYGKEFSGAYFGLVSAMGGFVQVVNAADGTKSLVATLGAPHALADGVTPNVGSMQAFLPNSVINTLFGLPADNVDTSSLTVTRTESDATTTVPFTVNAVTGGVIIKLSDISFSSPVYTIKKAVAATTQSSKSTAISPSPVASTSPVASPSPASSAAAAKTTASVVADKDKSTIRVDGQNIAADSTATYRLVITIRDKNNLVIKNQKPVLTADKAANVQISRPTLVGDEWWINVISSTAGEKIITTKVGSIQLNETKMTFVAVAPVAVTSPSPSIAPVVTVPALQEPVQPVKTLGERMIMPVGILLIILGLWYLTKLPTIHGFLSR